MGAVGLVEGLPDGGGDDGVLALGDMGEGVADPVNPAPLPGCLEDPRDGGLEAGMGECLKLCVSDRAHAVFRYGQASKRPANIMAS